MSFPARSLLIDLNMDGSSETQYHLPANHFNWVTQGGHPNGTGRHAAGSSLTRSQDATNLDHRLRKLELDAYIAVIRAFQARSDSVSWVKHMLMFVLRKELRVTDEQHQEILARLSLDEEIRKWRQLQEAPPALAAREPIRDPASDSAVPHSPINQNSMLAMQAHRISPPPPTPRAAPRILPPAYPRASSKKGGPVGPRGQTSKGGRLPPVVAATTTKTPTGPSAGRGSNFGRGPAPAEARVRSDSPSDHQWGQRVKTPGKGLYSLL